MTKTNEGVSYMGFLDRVFSSAQSAFKEISGDKKFLHAACAASANVAAADGKIEESEETAAIKAMLDNAVLKGNFTSAEIDSAFNEALSRVKTRTGRAENEKALEAMAHRDENLRKALFLIAADVADDNGIGEDEHKVLATIAGILSVDKAKLLG